MRIPASIFSRRQNDGGSAIVWGALSLHGCRKLAILKDKMNSLAYIDFLHYYLLSCGQGKHPNGFIFQQDGAIVHRYNAMLELLHDSDIEAMYCPARDPHLRLIENWWGILVRCVYRNYRQFGHASNLEGAILYEWKNCPGGYCTPSTVRDSAVHRRHSEEKRC